MSVKAVDDSRILVSGLRLTDLNKPIEGKALDATAKIRTNENVTWEVIVFWINEEGKRVYTAYAGEKYYPCIVFFIPEGYKVHNRGEYLKLPQFVADLYGTDSLFIPPDIENIHFFIQRTIMQINRLSGKVMKNTYRRWHLLILLK